MPSDEFDQSEDAIAAALNQLRAHVDRLECSIAELENHLDKKLWELERDLQTIKNVLLIGR